jgi:hypothetical protein
MEIPIWLVPSFYGDVRLLATGKDSCTLVTENLTQREREALTALTTQARKKGWIGPDDTLTAPKVDLDIAVEPIARAIARKLKPDRKVVSAVKFASGRMEEISEATYTDQMSLPEAKALKKKDKAEAATSVAAPTRGCPAPEFIEAELKARDVLMRFLTPEQREDFLRFNRFISVGATTGRRYMVTSRHARDSLAQYHRTLYDLEDHLPLCVHDWSVPAAEEMLALHVFLQLPGWERYLRRLEN